MAVLDEALISYLKAIAGITAIVGTRVYGVRAPQGVTLPCLTVQRISTAYEHTHDTVGATGNYAQVRFQIDSWAETHSAAKQLSDTVKGALNGKRGAITTGAGGVTIGFALVQEEDVEDDPDLNFYRVRTEYMIGHTE